jgi:hypothetical protein
MKLTLTREGVSPLSLVIDNPKINYGKVASKTREGQNSLQVFSGSTYVNDLGGTVVRGELSLRFLTKTQMEQIDNFIVNTLVFDKHKFTVSVTDAPTVHCINIGKGHSNLTATGCNIGVNNTEGMFEVRAPGIYHMVLPFRYVRETRLRSYHEFSG